MTHESIGKFITDNTAAIAAVATLLTSLARWVRDSHIGRKRDAKQDVITEKAEVERKQLNHKLDRNTALTATVLDATAKNQGKSIHELIENADTGLDELLIKLSRDNEGPGDERKGIGGRRH